MREMNKILIIGTEPPCPRCSLLKMLVKEFVRRIEIEAEVKSVCYNDEESVKFANSLGLEPGTAKDVSKRINLEMDKDRLAELLKGSSDESSSGDCICNSFSSCNWSIELDEFLRPFENRAKESGILMTPVLIINGELKHSGSVPDIEKLSSWIEELKD